MLTKKYFLTVLGNFEKGTIEFDNKPTEKEISGAIKKMKGTSARVEERYVLENIDE